MKQIISVRAIVKRGDKTLLLKRSSGRESILGMYELPGGRLEYGEQPEDSLRRHLDSEAGVSIQVMQLLDAVTYVDRDDRHVQYTIILYLVSIGSLNVDVSSSKKYNHYDWIRLSDPQRILVTDSTKLLMDIYKDRSSYSKSSVGYKDINNNDVIKDTESLQLIIYSDGGSRGNPGPSAAGFVILDNEEHVIFEGGEYLGITTNNQSEYHGVRLGLEKALELNAQKVDFRIDSLLVVNQMNGIYKIKNRDLWPINELIKELVGRFDKVTFTHVRRELNQLADSMVNKILDAHDDSSS